MTFSPGLHHPSAAKHFDRCMIAVNTLRKRTGPFEVSDCMMDSGAFTQIAKHGGYPNPPEAYAADIIRWSTHGNLLCAVSQDYMTEPAMLEKTGLTVAEHQRLTIERYDRIRANAPASVHILPALQGYDPAEYVEHIRQYGARLTPGMWVGVGSVCKRNSNPAAIEEVLRAIKAERPDLKLHGFGLQLTALSNPPTSETTWSRATVWPGRSGRGRRGVTRMTTGRY